MSYWGYHLMLDLSGMNLDQMSSESNVKEFLETLLTRIDMLPIGPPHIEYTAGHLPDKAGFTFIQIIVTSSIVAHFVDATRTGYLDVFSCKPFDIGVVEDTVREFFSAEKLRVNYITRHAEGA